VAAFAGGSIAGRRLPVQSRHVEAFVVSWTLGAQEWSILIVDLPSSIAIAREPLLREVRSLIEANQPDIVIGDFNAPRLSRALCELPLGYRHAYEVVGCGWAYTWPVPLPLWAIDQCLVGPRALPEHYELRSTLFSDHRMQILDFNVPRDSNGS